MSCCGPASSLSNQYTQTLLSHALKWKVNYFIKITPVEDNGSEIWWEVRTHQTQQTDELWLYLIVEGDSLDGTQSCPCSELKLSDTAQSDVTVESHLLTLNARNRQKKIAAKPLVPLASQHSQSSSVWSLALSFSIFLSSRSNRVLSFFSVPTPSSFLSSVTSWMREYSS